MPCKSCGKACKGKELYTCYRCPSKGCSECVVECCCDCSVRLCKECKNNHNIKCGCYGECSFCKKEVNSGDNGWPCYSCKKWLCIGCINTLENKCTECKDD